MLISDELNDAMNEQIGSELGASNQYLQLAGYFQNEDLPELASFFFRQSEEERQHALKFVHYILETGGQVTIPEVPQPPQAIKSAEQAAQMAFDWEVQVTAQINNLHRLAHDHNDFAALNFLSWFAEEQLEEVATMGELLRVIQRAGDQLLLVESYVARRGDPHG